MLSKKRSILVIFLSLMFVSIFAPYCLASDILIADTLGREVLIPQEVNRILAVGCSLREVLSFDVADKIVGIEYREKAETDEKEPRRVLIYHICWLSLNCTICR